MSKDDAWKKNIHIYRAHPHELNGKEFTFKDLTGEGGTTSPTKKKKARVDDPIAAILKIREKLGLGGEGKISIVEEEKKQIPIYRAKLHAPILGKAFVNYTKGKKSKAAKKVAK